MARQVPRSGLLSARSAGVADLPPPHERVNAPAISAHAARCREPCPIAGGRAAVPDALTNPRAKRDTKDAEDQDYTGDRAKCCRKRSPDTQTHQKPRMRRVLPLTDFTIEDTPEPERYQTATSAGD